MAKRKTARELADERNEEWLRQQQYQVNDGAAQHLGECIYAGHVWDKVEAEKAQFVDVVKQAQITAMRMCNRCGYVQSVQVDLRGVALGEDLAQRCEDTFKRMDERKTHAK
jgi:hypothetical protein